MVTNLSRMKIYSAHGSGGYGQKVTAGEVLLAGDD